MVYRGSLKVIIEQKFFILLFQQNFKMYRDQSLNNFEHFVILYLFFIECKKHSYSKILIFKRFDDAYYYKQVL